MAFVGLLAAAVYGGAKSTGRDARVTEILQRLNRYAETDEEVAVVDRIKHAYSKTSGLGPGWFQAATNRLCAILHSARGLRKRGEFVEAVQELQMHFECRRRFV